MLRRLWNGSKAHQAVAGAVEGEQQRTEADSKDAERQAAEHQKEVRRIIAKAKAGGHVTHREFATLTLKETLMVRKASSSRRR